ncbi:TldD/PmbA family protein [bacterium]|nr:TldD/PmbA family protein [bacterium]
MIDRILDKAKHAVDFAEVYCFESFETEVSFESGKLKNVEYKNLSGVGLRVIHNGAIGFSSSTDPNRFDDMVEYARESAKFGKKVDFEFPGKSGFQPVATFDSAVEEFTSAEAVEEGKRAVSALRELVPKGLTDVDISASHGTVRLANTSGLDVSYRVTDFSHSIVSVIVDGDSILWIGDGGNYGNLTVRTDDYVRKIADLAKKARKKAPHTAGNLPVIFVAEELHNLLESIEMGIDGKRLVKGDSPLIGREGERVLGTVTLVDDPLIDFATGSRPFDDEGVTSRKNVLFENGVFRSFLFDIDTAAKAGRTTTASAERDALSMPSIESSNIVMSPGTSSLEKMIGDLDEGVVVYGVLGGGQSNLLAGDFALNIMLGFLIRKGEFAGRLTDTMISGNVYKSFDTLAAAGSEIKSVGSQYHVPDVLFSNLSISSR